MSKLKSDFDDGRYFLKVLGFEYRVTWRQLMSVVRQLDKWDEENRTDDVSGLMAKIEADYASIQEKLRSPNKK